MSHVADLTLRDTPLLDKTVTTAPNATYTIENWQYVPVSDQRFQCLFFGWMTGSTHEKFERALTVDDTVETYQPIANVGSRRAYYIESDHIPDEYPCIFALLREYTILELDSERDSSGLHITALFPSQDAVQAVLRRVNSIGNLHINSLSAEGWSESERTTLTEKQRNAIQLADQHGYFENPSQITLDELAEACDITPQTLSKHIRVGVKKLVEENLSNPSP